MVHENTGSGSNAAGGTFSKATFKNTNTDGAAAEVDVDDPDFWTKVVGEAKEEEEEEIGKRKRAQQSYSEKEYLKRLDAAIRDGVEGSDVDDDASLSSEYSNSGEVSEDDHVLDNEALKTIVKATKSKKKEERYVWGGSSQSEWKQADAEAVLKVLQSFGYGNISWQQVNAMLSPSKPMKLEEIKRMSWSLPLLTLYEAAEDDALEVTRKAEAASKAKQPEGDVLGRTGDNDAMDVDKEDNNKDSKGDGAGKSGDDGVIDVDKEPTIPEEKPKESKDQLEECFKKLVAGSGSWVEKALADALAFSKTLASGRDRAHVQSILDGHRPAINAPAVNPSQVKLAADFEQNVWPGLRSRGWKKDEKSKSSGYTYQNKTYKSITKVLDVIPKFHPELMNMANSLIASVAATCEKSSASEPVAPLDPNNVTAKSLKLFLMDCAPLQLLADRKRPHRIALSKRLLTKVGHISALYKAVTTADSSVSSEATIEERNLQLSKLININPRTTLPHPDWTLLHDAILIRAVTKHGWADKNSTCLAIGNDKTIRWGAPFEPDQATKADKKPEADPEEEEKQSKASYDQLFTTASRAVKFLTHMNKNFADELQAATRNSVRERLVTSFGLAQDESSESEEVWKVDETELKKILRPAQEKAASDCEALPSKRKLFKRITKLANSFAG